MRRLLLASLVLAGCGSRPAAETKAGEPPVSWNPALVTESVSDDPDDPAIWVHPTDPALSLVLGTNKVAAPAGALVVFDLDGKILQSIARIDRPNNVDIRGNLAAVTERNKSALRLFSIDPATRRVSDLASIPVFAGETGDFAAPMGIALYQRASDGALFAIVGRKSGPSDGYLWQYRITEERTLTLVRKFGRYSGKNEIESIVADDARGFVYYSDEGAGIHKYHADPDHPDAPTELALFATSGYAGDHEGLAVVGNYLVSCDQIDGQSRYVIYRRDGDNAFVAAYTGVDATDGLEATAAPLGPKFPTGLLVAMNSMPKNFAYFAWPPPGLQP